MASTLGTTPTKTQNIELIKGQYREFDFEIPWLTQSMVDAGIEYTLSWWGLYVRPVEDGAVLAENSKDTEEVESRIDWVFAEKKITVKFHEDFSYTVPKGTATQQYDIALIGLFGKRVVPVQGTFQFKALYTRDDDTEGQVWNSSTSWTTTFCEALADQRTALLGIPETGTTVSISGAADDTTIQVSGGSPTISFSIGDDIGIELDTGLYFETTVKSVVSGLEYELDTVLPSAAANGNGIYKGKCNHTRCGT